MAATDQPTAKLYQSEIAQMMFVFGEISEPLDETTELVEELCRAQIIELIVQAVAQAQKRGSKNLSSEDLIFLIRHDRKKSNRLRMFLSWKDVRKNVKESKDGPAKDGGVGENEIDEDELTELKTSKAKKMKIKFSWDLVSSYENVLSDGDDSDKDEDPEEIAAYEDQLLRLKTADDVTRTMTRDEYIYYSDCRQASFTYKKLKRFREWSNMHIHYKNFKPNNDVIDILGFLACESVAKITEAALAVKKEWDASDILDGGSSSRQNKSNGGGNKSGKSGGSGDQDEKYLFGKNTVEQSPLQPAHIKEAFRRLQKNTFAMGNFRGGLLRTPLTLF